MGIWMKLWELVGMGKMSPAYCLALKTEEVTSVISMQRGCCYLMCFKGVEAALCTWQVCLWSIA